MIQAHLLQILCMIAMSPPSDLTADSIRDAKVKVLKSLPAASLLQRAARENRARPVHRWFCQGK
ncbi:hypothetical protein ACNKHS_11005 [Shigella flexneri]